MSDHISSTAGPTNQTNGKSPTVSIDWSGLPILESAEIAFPQLGVPGAWPVARDRLERIVTCHEVPTTPEVVWRALTDPAAIGEWLAVCHSSLEQVNGDCMLDFEDGEFLVCRPTLVRPPRELHYLWRWLGIGPLSSIGWSLDATAHGTRITVTQEAKNPPRDWQTWHGEGWPGILNQLAAYLRTGTRWRWPWRRMGPYAVIELPVSAYEAWDRLFGAGGPRYWLLPMGGSLEPGQAMTILMGDASGTFELMAREVVQPGESPPSFLPSITFTARRSTWGCEVGGRVWLEPAGWGQSILQVFMWGWEHVQPHLQLSERSLLTGYWADAMRRAHDAVAIPGQQVSAGDRAGVPAQVGAAIADARQVTARGHAEGAVHAGE